MANATFTLDSFTNSDATFRAWGSAISAQFAAIGYVQTSDTGQINWTTVTDPGASTDAGYEVWRFNDSLQGSAPIFFKLYYGTGTTTNGPRLRVEVGTASNGSGTLSGTGSGTVHTVVNLAASGPLGITSALSSDGSGLCFAHQPETTTTSARCFFSIDRFRNASGVAQSGGFGLTYMASSSSTASMVSVDTANAAVDTRTAMPAVLPSLTGSDTTNRSSLLNNELFFYPTLLLSADGIFYSKMTSWYWARDAASSAVLDVEDALGATRTLRTIAATNMPVAGAAGGAYFAAAMWWAD